jgi:uncharacterized protein (UPF0332 family)
MDSIEFLEDAEEFLKSEKASLLRSAVSRSYYSFFHHATELAHEINLDLVNAPSHQALHDAFCLSTERDLKRIGNQLKQAKRLRVRADYELKDNLRRNDGYSHVKRVRKAIEQCRILVENEQEASG